MSMIRKPRKQESTKARKHERKIARQNEIGEIRTHIGVNHYIYKSRPVEIMKIFIHLVPSCYRAIVLSLNRAYFFYLHAMKETFRMGLINKILHV